MCGEKERGMNTNDFLAIIAIVETATDAATLRPVVLHPHTSHARASRYIGFHRVASHPQPALHDIPREFSRIVNALPSLASSLQERSNATFPRA